MTESLSKIGSSLLEILNSAEEIEELLRQFARDSASSRENRLAEIVVSAMQRKKEVADVFHRSDDVVG